jgi:hypothetical protein
MPTFEERQTLTLILSYTDNGMIQSFTTLVIINHEGISNSQGANKIHFYVQFMLS